MTDPAIGIAFQSTAIAFAVVQFTAALANAIYDERTLIRLTRTKLAFPIHIVSFVS
jgi:hypothetical protein